MPELPEVEITRQEIEPWMVGHYIKYTEIRNPYLRWPISKEIILLHDALVFSVQRRAKYLLIELNESWIIIHLGMSGCLNVLAKPRLPEKHNHIDLFMSNGCVIRYKDPRRFGAWLWSQDLHNNQLFTKLGLEPFSEKFNGYWLYKKSINKRIQIKPWLMNNKLIVGIGNIYANEALFIANILPYRTANSLSQKESILLADTIKMVLLHSIKNGGTTIKNFLHINNIPGMFVQQLKVYGRNGRPCVLCQRKIKVIKQSGRSTFFCSYCQY